MTYQWIYKTPKDLDNIMLKSDGEFLTELWFILKDSSKNSMSDVEKNLPIFQETSKWLDAYFDGQSPNFIPKFKIENLTPFRKDVLEILQTIPFGKTITYLEIAERIAKKRGIKKMSSQAVGGAVGWNPICIMIPCHRVVGANGNLTGYHSGMKNKIALLEIEGNDMTKFFLPK